jgi:AraC-like DNA-binding protein
MMNWMIILLTCLLLWSVSLALQIVITHRESDFYPFTTLNLFRVLAGVGLFGLMASPLFFPQILYGMPQLPLTGKQPPDKYPWAESPKKAGLLFESEYLNEIEERCNRCMEQGQLYLKHECNLNDLSRCIHIPPHHLAYYFRVVRHESINDYRNHWRVKHAKQLLISGNVSGLTIEAVGLQSGFSSKSTFFAAFKKAEGITPKTFLKNAVGPTCPEK